MGSVRQLIYQWAPKFGLDPRAVAAIGMHEGGLRRGAVGDHGTSFGPFQLHVGGALPSGKNAAWAGSDEGILYAMRQMSKVAGGLTGQAAVSNIAQRFERPANPGGEIADAMRYYGGGAAIASGGGAMPSSFTPTSSDSSKQIAQLMAMNMLQRAGNTVAGVQSNPGDLMQLALMRSQMGAAQEQNGPAYNPNHHGGWAGKTLEGNTQMVVGGNSPYSNLRFDSHVDWRHVNPRLLKSVNAVAAAHGVVATVNSGYRSNAYSAKSGGFAGDPHTKGIAIDAYIGGKPIGDLFGSNVWAKYGIRSGNSFIYHGKPDPEHLDLLGG